MVKRCTKMDWAIIKHETQLENALLCFMTLNVKSKINNNFHPLIKTDADGTRTRAICRENNRASIFIHA